MATAVRGNKVQLVSPPSDVTITVTFASTPASASSSYADLKYNKQSVFNLEFDDAPVQFMYLIPYLQGGVSGEDGVTYPGKFFTDGCGNNKPWTAGVGINVKSNFNDTLILSGGTKMTESDLNTVLAANCLPENHGYYHNNDAGYYITNGMTLSTNISMCTSYILTKCGFKPRVFITPNNDAGYNVNLVSQGYMANSSQGVTDGYPQSPVESDLWSTHVADTSEISASFRAHLRGFLDDWNNTTETNNMKSYVDNLKNLSSSTVHKLYRVGSHGHNSSNWANFKAFLTYVETVSSDTIWVTTLQELLEYFEVKRQLIKSETLSGNTLTINLSYANISVDNRYRDITLLINSATAISSISVTGSMDSSSYNTSTKLINVFKKKTTGFSL